MPEQSRFEPGSYWDPARRTASLERMIAIRDSDEMQAMMRAIGEMAAEGDPAAAAAFLATSAPTPTPAGSISRERCVFRRGRDGDAADLAALIVAGELPPFFLEPYIEGFLVIEHDRRLIGAGGLEFYGDDAVVRSVVVDPAARGLGLGLEIARLLEADAVASGARDIYLFTLHAWPFWKRLGYADLPLDRWPEPVRENWQYQFVTGFPAASRDVHAMVKASRTAPRPA